MKVGIITHYYKSLNYGGSLQAYALCRVLREMGVEAEQICYDMGVSSVPKGVLRRIKRTAKKVMSGAWGGWEIRKKRFFSFQESIPHSQTVCCKDHMTQVAEEYDLFITGSDQVWNTQWYHSAFFLDFVPKGKEKIAYAACVGKKEISEEDRRVFQKYLQDYRAISVREADAVDMVTPCTPVPVVQTLDPTLLLSARQWDDLCAERMIDEKYIFCFLLGYGKQEREVVSRFAKEKGLRLVTLPHFPCDYRASDAGFGNIRLYDVAPAEFISLIKHAAYVFTDSFHAAVFSGIYQKDFFVLERSGGETMRSRILSLLALFGCGERFLDQPEKTTYEYMIHLPVIDYSRARSRMEAERSASIAFFKNNVVSEV